MELLSENGADQYRGEFFEDAELGVLQIPLELVDGPLAAGGEVELGLCACCVCDQVRAVRLLLRRLRYIVGERSASRGRSESSAGCSCFGTARYTAAARWSFLQHVLTRPLWCVLQRISQSLTDLRRRYRAIKHSLALSWAKLPSSADGSRGRGTRERPGRAR